MKVHMSALYLSAKTVELDLQSLQETPPLTEFTLSTSQGLVAFFDLWLHSF